MVQIDPNMPKSESITDGRTHGPTDPRKGSPSYTVALSQLKMIEKIKMNKVIKIPF